MSIILDRLRADPGSTKIPLTAIHRALELLERDLDERMLGEEPDVQLRWQHARTPHAVRYVGGTWGDILRDYAALAEIACKREAMELEALMAEFRPAADADVRELIIEASEIEKRL